MEGKTQTALSKEEFDDKKINDKLMPSFGATENVVRVSSDDPFDICPVKAGINLKPALIEKNRMKRKEDKLSAEGQSTSYLRPGMLLLKGFLSFSDQIRIVKLCRDLGLGHGGFYQPGYKDGSKLHLKMMCLGKNWDPETSKYGEVRCDGARPPPIPIELKKLVEYVLLKSHTFLKEFHKVHNASQELPLMSPDICIVNFYTKTGRLGLHQDKDECLESINRGLPVVSFSIGDSAEFLYSDYPDNNPDKVELKSGDVLIFGGKSRKVFHGVSSIISDSTSKALLEETNLRPGRINLTFRKF
ncbi:alpha-ketoglutarate-dependent dioxygenase abh1-like [Impatiens glandulifera]|uniref:alpha-ketoglutarate-dependent dioxygenase abh1-like n=1 Tax=Impatiens glandulifera TaxID=253017 RepID=UPI001FB10485|nr:alpha-ketoglutarate-dependent dioxygenase abh1-like [Impatiens glandulifera]